MCSTYLNFIYNADLLQAELEELATAEARSKVEKFLATENSIVTKPVDAFSRTTEGSVCFISVATCIHYCLRLRVT